MDEHARYNREAWDGYADKGNQWTVPYSPEMIAAARRGDWTVGLTNTRRVPRGWFPESLAGLDILGLASGGGQQVPIFAAAGGNVTVIDNSPRQLEADRSVAEREGLTIRTELGDMRDLSRFEDASFDLIYHPVSNCFVPEVLPIYRHAARVLRPGGRLLAGFNNPSVYMFDYFALDDSGELVVRHKVPHADVDALTEAELQRMRDEGMALEWSHSLNEQIGGQIAAGLVIAGFYTDTGDDVQIDRHIPNFIATLAFKPPLPADWAPA